MNSWHTNGNIHMTNTIACNILCMCCIGFSILCIILSQCVCCVCGSMDVCCTRPTFFEMSMLHQNMSHNCISSHFQSVRKASHWRPVISGPCNGLELTMCTPIPFFSIHVFCSVCVCVFYYLYPPYLSFSAALGLPLPLPAPNRQRNR